MRSQPAGKGNWMDCRLGGRQQQETAGAGSKEAGRTRILQRASTLSFFSGVVPGERCQVGAGILKVPS